MTDWVVRHFGGRIIRVPVDEHGMDVHRIGSICRNQKIRAIYLTPHHHYPTTVTMSAERRMELLRIAEQHDIVLVEDDYDYDYHYEGAPILPLASMSRGNVIYVGSFSKQLAPSVRVGYLTGNPVFIEQVSRIRRIIDRQGDPLLEFALAEMIREGRFSVIFGKPFTSTGNEGTFFAAF